MSYASGDGAGDAPAPDGTRLSAESFSSEWVVIAVGQGVATGQGATIEATEPAFEVGQPASDPVVRLSDAFGHYFTLVADEPRRVRRTYYDSFDGLIRDAGWTLSCEAGRLTLAARDGSGERLRVQLSAPPAMLSPAKIDDPDMRAALESVLGVRVCLVLAQATLRVRELRILDELTKTVARGELIEVDGMAPRLRLHRLRGYDAELDRVQALLDIAPGISDAGEPFVDALARAAGANPAGTSASVSVGLRWDEPAQLSVARVLGALGAIYEANLPGTLSNLDHEFLHDLRVTVRRARTVVRELRGVFTESDYAQISGDLRWLQQVTGPTRDLDVQIDEFGDLAGMLVEPLRDRIAPLERILRAEQRRARMQMERDLKGQRITTLTTHWRGLVQTLPTASLIGRADAMVPVGLLASARILKLYRRMVKMGKAIGPGSSPTRYHDLRKQGKELRYMLELFGRPIYDQQVIAPMISTLKGLQDVLGRHQDLDVQAHTLLAMAGDVAGDPQAGDMLLAIGGLVQRFESDAAAARGQFKTRFRAFASDERRQLVETTFRGSGS